VSDLQIWLGLATLTGLEVVLGIDNLVFIAVLVSRVRQEYQAVARNLGLSLALGIRLLMLAGLNWVAHLTTPALLLWQFSFSWRDLILIGGGFFLLYKGTVEIHNRIEGDGAIDERPPPRSPFGVVLQILLVDVVFSLDSVITAVGMVQQLWVMFTAVIISIAFMLLAAGPTTRFVEQHPTVKMLVFSFLLLIGMTLVADGFGMHVPKGYVYAAMLFSTVVETLNQLARRRHVAPARRDSG
jgi:predicted tellurium resistance membrane protein TerC